MIDIFQFFEFFHKGGITKHNILIIHKTNSIYRFVELLNYTHLSYFCSMVLATRARKLVVLYNIIDQNYRTKHSRYLFYHLQLLIHHLQVIRNEHPSRFNLIIKTLLQIKTRKTFQIQMISTHVYKISSYTAKISLKK